MQFSSVYWWQRADEEIPDKREERRSEVENHRCSSAERNQHAMKTTKCRFVVCVCLWFTWRTFVAYGRAPSWLGPGWFRRCRELNNVDHVFRTDRLAEITTMLRRDRSNAYIAEIRCLARPRAPRFSFDRFAKCHKNWNCECRSGGDRVRTFRCKLNNK